MIVKLTELVLLVLILIDIRVFELKLGEEKGNNKISVFTYFKILVLGLLILLQIYVTIAQ